MAAYRLHLSNGTIHTINIADNLTIRQARRRFVGVVLVLDKQTKTEVVAVDDAVAASQSSCDRWWVMNA